MRYEHILTNIRDTLSVNTTLENKYEVNFMNLLLIADSVHTVDNILKITNYS